jgi:hypothetical protein
VMELALILKYVNSQTRVCHLTFLYLYKRDSRE